MNKSEFKHNNISSHINKVLKMHRDQVASSDKLNNDNVILKQRFNKHQEAFFDQQAAWYISSEATPPEVKTNLTKMFKLLAQKLNDFSQDKIKVLDVGCGSGVLIPFIRDTFKNPHIHGIDLSKAQLSNLKEKFPEVQSHHGDISDFNIASDFHLIVCNACFGNFFSQQEALAAMTKLINEEGYIAISHPLGAGFVEKLHSQDANTVPHHLPIHEDEINQLCATNNLTVSEFINEELLYLLVLKKTASKAK